METRAISNSNSILKRIEYCIGEFKYRHGIAPTNIIISHDYIKYIEAEMKEVLKITGPVRYLEPTLLGLNVLVVEGKTICYICIL